MTIADRHVDAPKRLIYGPRKASEIRGFMVHMAEGNNVARYLSGNPRRGVSVQYTVEADGEIVSMVPELRVAGSLNPAALRKGDDKGGYYGRSHLDHVLRGGVTNPNHYVIAVEVAGKAVDGPNAKQIDALVRLFRDCRTRYEGIKPLGHRDQQDVKRCPGKTHAMRRAFYLMGGHGKDYDPAKPKPEPPVDDSCAQKLEDLEESEAARTVAIRRIIAELEDLLPDETEDV